MTGVTETYEVTATSATAFSHEADTVPVAQPAFPETLTLRTALASVTVIVIPMGAAVGVPTADYPVRVDRYSSASLHVPTDMDSLFARLTEEWRQDTVFHSSPVEIALHPAYQQIIGLGSRAVSLILRDLAQRGGHWFWALRAITGEDPASEQTSMPGAARAWLEWGRRNGYWQ